ncbi:GNAT family N-acetyltransferase [Corticicoccus populi]|uniref:GNAT family N-acetyltransferase n=1 Tax=Corticicoccus populi TaxID=1812821 RepID=A0ABW5WWL9_9STAP
MEIYSAENIPNKKIVKFFKSHWGSSEMVLSSGVYDCSKLDGFAIVNDKEEIIGLITYIIKGKEIEIISLDSIDEGKGIGTFLVQEIEKHAVKKTCNAVRLITTNDNLSALKFYQKRGFVLKNIINNAVNKARKLKPEIPLIGNNGIPIRDEIELIKKLD